MPQLNLSFYISQLFWLCIAFLILFLFIKCYFYPKINGIMEERNNIIHKKENDVKHLQDILDKKNREIQNQKEKSEKEHQKKINEKRKELNKHEQNILKTLDFDLNAEFDTEYKKLKPIHLKDETIKEFADTVFNKIYKK